MARPPATGCALSGARRWAGKARPRLGDRSLPCCKVTSTGSSSTPPRPRPCPGARPASQRLNGWPTRLAPRLGTCPLHPVLRAATPARSHPLPHPSPRGAGAPHPSSAGRARGGHQHARGCGDRCARRLGAGDPGGAEWGRDRPPRPGPKRARGRVRAKRDRVAQAVVGRFAPHHAFWLTAPLSHRDLLEAASARVSAAIDHRLAAERAAMAVRDTIPGVRGAHRRSGARRERPRSPAACRARGIGPRGRGGVPAPRESGGRRLSGTTRTGPAWRRRTVVEMAHVAAQTTQTSLAAQ
jgi:hypothetical protein